MSKMGSLGGMGGKGSGMGGMGSLKPTAPVKPEQTAEAEAEEELSEALAAFKDAAKSENDRFVSATSPDYWFGVYFETQDQRDEFLKLLSAFDLLETQWVNGRKLAERLRFVLKSPRLPRRSYKIDAKFTEMSL